jgi:hypothetical protein
MAAPENNQFWKLRSSHGRDLIFSSPQVLWEACKEYFEATDKRKWKKQQVAGKPSEIWELETDTPYTLTGLCVFLDIDTQTWTNYKARKDFFGVITRVENIMFTQKFEGASVGAFNANIIARDLGLADKKQTDHTTGGEKFDLKKSITDFLELDEGDE